MPAGHGLFQRVPSICPVFAQPSTFVNAPVLPQMPATLVRPVILPLLTHCSTVSVLGSVLPFDFVHTV